jgi:hypothetical protein
MTVSWTKERDKKVMIEEGETEIKVRRGQWRGREIRIFSIISDRSLSYTVFYPTNSVIGNKESSAIYVRFHVSTP